MNRIAYQFRSLPPGERPDEISSYLESQPNYGELTLHANADLGAISITIPRIYTYIYKDYFIEVIPINKQLVITCHKITAGLLTQKYSDLRDKLATLNIYIQDFEKELRIKEHHTRNSTKLYMLGRLNSLKREIKAELRAMGVDVRPGSGINKLLRQDYLPEVE